MFTAFYNFPSLEHKIGYFEKLPVQNTATALAGHLVANTRIWWTAYKNVPFFSQVLVTYYFLTIAV